MQASRVLRSAISTKGFLIPPRTSWDLFASAGSAVLSLISSQESRKEYDNFLQKGMIQQDVLGRAGQPMGTAMILALYNDLHSPVLQKYGFDTGEFLEGVKPALEQFHNIHCNLMNSMHEESAKIDEDDTEPTEEEELSFENLKKDRQNAVLAAMVGLTHDNKLLRRFLKVQKNNWNKVAEDDPDSIAGQLKRMVTSEFFSELQRTAQMKQIIEESLNNVVTYDNESAEVSNLALLSARTMVIDFNDSHKQEIDVERLKDEELSVADQDVDDRQRELGQKIGGIWDNLPVAAQVEVLYEIKKTLTINNSTKEEDSESSEDTMTTRTDVSVLVAVLEGWLNGDPAGNGELQWRLVSSRYPWEFASMSNY